jgi:hypothetical protein
MTEKKYISQIELAKLTCKKRQWINYLAKQKDFFDLETIAGKPVIIWNQKVNNYIRENN